VRTFKDTAGRTWSLSLNILNAKKLRDTLAIDLFDENVGETIARLSGDPVLLADVLFLIVKDEADAKGISDEDFGSALGGDVITTATESFLEELVDFYPEKKRAILQGLLVKINQAEERLMDETIEMIGSEAMDRFIEEQITEMKSRLDSSGNKSS
jgi:hypothetical protein